MSLKRSLDEVPESIYEQDEDMGEDSISLAVPSVIEESLPDEKRQFDVASKHSGFSKFRFSKA